MGNGFRQAALSYPRFPTIFASDRSTNLMNKLLSIDWEGTPRSRLAEQSPDSPARILLSSIVPMRSGFSLRSDCQPLMRLPADELGAIPEIAAMHEATIRYSRVEDVVLGKNCVTTAGRLGLSANARWTKARCKAAR